MRVVDGITFDDCKAELKAWLGITGTSEDDLLEMYFDAAVEAADRYLMRDFVPNKYRWTFSGTPEAGDKIDVSVYSQLDEETQEASYTVVSGDTTTSIARELLSVLQDKVYSSEYSSTFRGSSLILWSTDYLATVEASCEVTLVGTGSLVVSEVIEWDDLPKQVIAAIYAYIKAARDLRFRGHGVQGVKTGSLSESYYSSGGSSSVASADPTTAMIMLLRPYKLPLFVGRVP